jgi:hypothetical protein
MDEIDRQRFIAAQPIRRVHEFARLLGWNDLRLWVFPRPESAGGFFAAYCTTDEKFNLQIAPCPSEGEDCYTAAIVAERYGITAVPHQRFTLFADSNALAAEANRLTPLLARSNFKNPQWRRWFAEQYPIWIMHRYRRRNKLLNHQRDRAMLIAAEMLHRGLNPYDFHP